HRLSVVHQQIRQQRPDLDAGHGDRLAGRRPHGERSEHAESHGATVAVSKPAAARKDHWGQSGGDQQEKEPPMITAGRREWLGLAAPAPPTLPSALDFSVLFLPLPHLGAALHAGPTQLLWITDGYGFIVAAFLVTMGTLGDRIGRRRLLMIGAAAFG